LPMKRALIFFFTVTTMTFPIFHSHLHGKNTIGELPVLYGYKIVNIYPHDPKAFTQGLIFDQGFLYEGTGLYGQSHLRKVELETGKVLKSCSLPYSYFGEGVTLWKDKLIQLTWREKTGFIYSKDSFRLLRKFSYPTEGWGITHDHHRLIMSDGSAMLYFLDPESFKPIGRITVCDRAGPVNRLNELEYVKGKIYANIWRTDRIAILSPETGKIEGWIVLSDLLSQEDRSGQIDVLNGIAYDSKQERLFVTGKLWPKLFEIQLTSPKSR